MSGFQTLVNTQPAPGVAGDFCDANPRATVDFGAGGAVAGANGVFVARFAWTQAYPLDTNNAPQIVNNFGSGPVAGFVHREQQGLITRYLDNASQLVPVGFGVTLFSAGGFWVINSGTAEATIGMKAYANFANGLASFAATGSPTTVASGTASTIAAGTGSFTGSIAGDIMTITAVGSGVAVVGGILSGTGVASGTSIVSQISGTPGGIGVYSVNIPDQAVASTTISETYGTLTVGGTVTGTFGVGDVITGSTTAAGTIITALGTGTGGAGTYIVNLTQTVGSATLSAAGNVETKWIAMSAGPAGSLIKISSWPLG